MPFSVVDVAAWLGRARGWGCRGPIRANQCVDCVGISIIWGSAVVLSYVGLKSKRLLIKK
jgi:hypothetical protein